MNPMYTGFLKPLFDIGISAILLLISSPILIITTLLLMFNNKWNPLFFQLRPGKHGRNFKIIKFKTMTDAKSNDGNLLPDSQRLTILGRTIRRLSIDELPQLINVLKGDMSLVGPRPLLPEYLELYTKEQARRHLVKPGITGWAQVNGRNAITWEKKFEFDIWYVDHQSFSLDLKILVLTVKKVFLRDGINTEGEATTKPFRG